MNLLSIATKVMVDSMQKEGYTQKNALLILKTFNTVVKDAVARGERVHFYGFGTFYPHVFQARYGRNINTGQVLNVPKRTLPRFKSSRDGFMKYVKYKAKLPAK